MCLCVALALGGVGCLLTLAPCVYSTLRLCPLWPDGVLSRGGRREKKNCSSRFLLPPFALAIFRPPRFISPRDGGGGSFNRDICLAEPLKEATPRLVGFV